VYNESYEAEHSVGIIHNYACCYSQIVITKVILCSTVVCTEQTLLSGILTHRHNITYMVYGITYSILYNIKILKIENSNKYVYLPRQLFSIIFHWIIYYYNNMYLRPTVYTIVLTGV